MYELEQGCCALTGDGVSEGLDWFADRISQKTFEKPLIKEKPKKNIDNEI